MAEMDEGDHNAAVRNILENVMSASISGEFNSNSVPTENVAQLLAAAIAQAENSSVQVSYQGKQNHGTTGIQDQTEQSDFNINSLVPEKTDQQQADKPKAVSSGTKQKTLFTKFPIEVRRKIIAMRKDGKKSLQIAKELKASTSGVRKVWERFLATGMVHDLKPVNSGRPRKYPAPLNFELQCTSEGIVPTNAKSTHAEYVVLSEPAVNEAVTSTSAEEEDVFVEDPMDVPGATVEIVETDPGPSFVQLLGKSKKQPQIYRVELLLKLIKDCPLSVLREDVTKTSSPHVVNLNSLSKRSLFMESILGYPFGAVPPPKPFAFEETEAQVILSDPVDPLGKELLASLGYSTKVYFNMCCLPSPLLDPAKLVSDLPFSIGPGTITETTQSVLQLLVNLCRDPMSALSHVPSGSGPALVAAGSVASFMQVQVGVPVKLSAYWNMLFQFAADLGCCENFLSASPPSAPCLLCHPYQELVKNMEIKEPQEDEIWSPTPRTPYSTQLTTVDPLTEANMVKTKREIPRKRRTSENQLIVDGQFEVPSSIIPSSEISTPPLSSSAVTTESATTPLTVAPSAPSASQLTIMQTIQHQRDPTPQASTSPAGTESSLRRSPRKRPNTPRASVSEQTKPLPKKATSRTCVLSLTRCRQLKSTSPVQQECRGVIDWSIDDVAEFVASTPRCRNCASIFREHEVDGESLLLLDPEMMVKLMGIRSGAALKIHKRIQTIKNDCDS